MARAFEPRVVLCLCAAALLAAMLVVAAGVRAAGEADVTPPNAGGADSATPGGSTVRAAAGTQVQVLSTAPTGGSFLGTSIPPDRSGPPMGWVVY